MTRAAPRRALALALLAAVAALLAAPAHAQNAGTCVGACGGRGFQSGTARCYCDPACFPIGDCCTDVMTVCLVPVVESVSPTVASTAGGVTMTLTGRNFFNNAPNGVPPTLQLRTGDGTQSGTELSFLSWAENRITFSLPAGTGGAKRFYVRNLPPSAFFASQRQASVSLPIFSYSLPRLVSLTPSLGPTPGGTTLTITGSEFGNTGASVPVTVTVDGAACSVLQRTSSEIRCSVPAGQGLGRVVSVLIDGQASTDQLQYSYQAPSISGVSGLSGFPTAGGVSITLTGSNFGLTGATVTVGGQPCPVAAGYSHTSLTCTLPAGQGRNAPVVLTVAGQQSPSATLDYAAPVLSGFSAGNGVAATAGGSSVVLQGSNFGQLAVVNFGGVTCTNATVSCRILSQTHSSITMLSPPGEGTNNAVTVTVGDQVSNTATFAYAAPSVASVAPTDGPTAGGLNITVTGSNFGLSGSVTVGGFDCLTQVPSNHTRIVCRLPAGAGTNVPVVVTVQTRQSAAIGYTYQAPNVTSISPLTGPTQGGVSVTVSGTNFATTGIVRIGSFQCFVNSGAWNDTSAVCQLPLGEGTNLPVTVEVAGRNSSLLGQFALFSYAAPTVSTVAPLTATTAGAAFVTITGSNFGVAPVVTIGGAPCVVSTVTAAQVICAVPEGAGVSRPVNLTVTGYPQQTIASFNYSAPVVTSISPSVAPSGGGVRVTVFGSSFGLAASVTIGGRACTLPSSQHGRVDCTLPAGQGAALAVVVTETVSARASAPSTATFSYAPPTINSLSPSQAPTSGGIALVISGASMGLTPTVSVGGANCPVTANTSTSITCTLPVGSGASALVVVTAGGQTSNVASFSYAPPVVSSIAPPNGPTLGGINITLVGTSLGAPPAAINVTVGSAVCAVVAGTQNHTSVTCLLPAGVGVQPVNVAVNGQTATSTVSFAYDRPAVTSVAPALASTNGSTNVTLGGSNFGASVTGAVVLVGTSQAALFADQWNDTRSVVRAPVGQGADTAIVVSVGGIDGAPWPFGYTPPAITGILGQGGPTAGNVGITVQGTDFGASGASVTVNDRDCLNPVTTGHSQIVCTLPAGEGANRAVRVTLASQISAPFNYSYAAPTVSNITPNTAPTTGNVVVVVTGSNLGSTGTVSVGSSACFPTTGGWSDSSVQCTLPEGEGRNLTVTVTVAGQVSNSAVNFSYAAPTLTGVTPANGPSSGNVPVTITGTNFGVGGAVARLGGLVCLTTAAGHSSLVCRLPEGLGRNLNVSVATVGYAAVALLNSFSYDDPAVQSITPISAPTGGVVTLLTIQGTSFGAAATPGSVTVGGSPCALSGGGTSWDHGLVVCRLPDGEGTNRQVVVTNAQGRASTQPIFFNYSAPVLDSVSPTSAVTGGVGARNLTLQGSSFGLTATVSVGGVNCPVLARSHQQLVCSLPDGQGDGKAVTVTVTGATSNSRLFGYAAPFIASVSPANSPTVGGINVTLTGTSFGTNATAAVGGVNCPTLQVNHTNIICRMPAGEGTGLPWRVVVSQLPSTSAVAALSSYDAPNITQVTPNNGPTSGGVNITVTGSNFGLGSGVLQVSGRTCSPVALYNQTAIVCTLPAGEGLAQDVLLRVGALLSNTLPFNYDRPVVTGVAPNVSDTDGNVLVVVNGSNFGSVAVVAVGGRPCPVDAPSQTHTQLRCVLPAGQGRNNSVTVTVATQASLFNPNAVVNYNPPFISLVNPANGPTAGGMSITLTGTSFGVSSGQVTVNGNPCAVNPALYGHRSIVCSLPPGDGANRPVQLTVSGQSSNVQFFRYDNPVVSQVSPANGPTSGLTTITLTGVNFGTAGVVTVGTAACDQTGGLYRDNRIECRLPGGFGLNVPVQVNVSGQLSTVTVASRVNYDGPFITSVSPASATTAGSVSVTVQGGNFGCVAGLASNPTLSATLNGAPVTLTACSHTNLTFTLPAGTGTAVPLRVSVGSQQSNVFTGFSYAAPTMTSVSGCSGDASPRALDCPIAGGTFITVTGTNLGAAGAAVTVGNASCGSLTYLTPHTQVRCSLPAGVGFLLAVGVTVGGQSVSQPWLSYAGPVINSTSLRFTGASHSHFQLQAGNSTLVAATVNGGQEVEIAGRFFGSNVSAITVTYGQRGGAVDEYTCTNVTLVSADTLLRCRMAPGVGCDLPFRVSVATPFGLQVSAQSTQSVGYPAPTITPRTLKVQNGAEGPAIVGTESNGQFVLFRGTNFGADASKLRVFYGTNATMSLDPPGPGAQECTLVTLNSTDQVRCRTAPGEGGPFVFRLYALNAPSNVGNDTYTYPQPPRVFQVLGCVAQGNATINCPTQGGVLLTVLGDSFTSELMSVKIGPEDCGSLQFVSVNEVRCVLPVGSGFNQLVVVNTGLLFSRGDQLVSYAAPNITGLTGSAPCVSSQTTSIGSCPRAGNVGITLTGTNFGAARALVLIGGVACGNVTHDAATPHSRLTCVLPAGSGAARSVTLVQEDGEPSTNFAQVSYAVCPAGTRPDDAPGSVACLQCLPGSFTNQDGQPVCLQCENGFFTNASGSTACQPCSVGTFSQRSNGTGATACQPCAAGSFASATGQAVCTPCAPGRFANATGASQCELCAAGRFVASPGALACTQCGTGTFSAAGSLACDPCPPGTVSDGSAPCAPCGTGRYQDASGRSDCLDCGVGTASATTGQTSCPPCESGLFGNATRLTECYRCAAGRFSSRAPGATVGPTTCTPCPAGEFIGVEGQGTCLLCSLGAFSNTTGNVACTPCAQGRATASLGSQSCAACALGTFAIVTGMSRCLDCEFGSFANATGLAACVFCAPGSFQDQRGASACVPCPRDTFASAAGQAACARCSAGSYTSGTGAAVCDLCLTGQFKAGQSPLGQCELCPAGSFANSQGQGVCTPCEVGKFSNATGATRCTDCPAGRAAGSPGATSCAACDPGTAAPSTGSFACTQCRPGTFIGSSGALACTSCPVGRAQPLSGALACDVCQPGSYNPAVGQRACLECPAGKFSNATEAQSCVDCALGTSQSQSGRQSCSACPPGSFAGATGQAACTPCAPGQFQSASGTDRCVNCPVGTAAAAPAATVCVPCDAGRFADAVGSQACTQCAPGSFNNATQQVACVPCASGSFQSNPGQQACAFCGRGTYAPDVGAIACLPCPSGRFSSVDGTAPVTSCAPCGVGSAQPQAGSSACVACAAGTYSPTPALLSCLPCDPGRFANATGLVACSPCNPGSAQDRTGQSACVPCAVGTAMDSPSQPFCQACPSGRFASTTGNTACSPCAAGNFSLSVGAVGPTECQACPVGRFQGVAGQPQCNDCPPGTYGDTVGAQVCTPCAAGSFQSLAGQVSCQLCPPGTFSSGAGAVGCDQCPKGTANPASNASVCSVCPAGRYQGLTGQLACVDCGVGSYSSSAGEALCLQCPPGTYGNSSTAAQCFSCEAGRAQSAAGQTSCLACDLGRYTAATGQLVCTDCPLGEFAGVTGSSACTACSAGRFAPTVASAACRPCIIGEFTAAVGAATCSQCAAGSFSDTEGAAQCTLCSPGSFQDRRGASGCQPCAAGSYAPGNGEVSCRPCPPGQFSNSTSAVGVGTCQVCPTGRFASAEGAERCEPCPVGTFASQEGAILCRPCSVGTFVNTTGASQCTPCPPGSFQDTPAASGCTLCPAGRSMPSEGQVFCTACQSGRFSNASGAVQCSLCGQGTFSEQLSPVDGPASCTLCPAGQFAAAEGQVQCQSCPLGRAGNVTGLSDCAPCPVGRFGAATGQVNCSLCDAGQFAPVEGSLSCTFCDVGRFGNATGLSTCSECPLGAFQPSTGQQSCVSCPPGSFGVVAGSVTCPLCPPGRFSNDAGSQNCTDCPAGTANSLSGQRDCAACPFGQFMDVVGQVQCKPCPLGTFANVTGLTQCLPCAPGTFENQGGQNACTQCPIGRVTLSGGQAACVDCTPGSFADVQGLSACRQCPTGRFEAGQGSVLCSACGTGRYQDELGQIECKPCDAGRFANVTGLPQCTPCAPGTFQQTIQQTQCQPCSMTQYADLAGSKSCKSCPPGRFGNSTGQPLCPACAPGRFNTEFELTSCQACPANQYADRPGQVGCESCPPGRFGNESGLALCHPCPAGSASNLFGASGCVPCEPGRVADREGKVQCDPCPVGTNTSLTGQAQCAACASGFFQDLTGQTTCKACPLGTFTGAPQQAECRICPAGTYATAAAVSSCTPCEPGRFSAAANASSCEACPPGAFTPTPGSTSCLRCSPGSFNTAPASSGCSLCLAGQFQAGVGASGCEQCVAGKFGGQPGLPQCETCQPGSFTNASQMTACIQCRPGELQPALGATLCGACPVGRFNDLPAQSSCVSCPARTFANFVGSTACTVCSPGQFNPLTEQSTCANCTVGRFAPEPRLDRCLQCLQGRFASAGGASQCDPCVPGRYQPGIGSTECLACAVGEFAASAGQPNCQVCPQGRYGTTTGVSACTACEPGRFGTLLAATTCQVCPPGTFSISDRASCTPCPPGRFSAASNSSECSDCQPGEFQAQEGATGCDPCPAGQFSKNITATSCTDCDAGRFTGAPGAQECTACPAGTVAQLKRSVNCSECPAGYFAVSGSSECTQCALGSISREPRAAACSSCDRVSTSNANRTVCVCAAGFYAAVNRSTFEQCSACPEGADCETAGLEQGNLTVLPGFWRPSESSLEFYRCLREEHCPGGAARSCQPHRVGPICAVCERGFHSFFGGECVECASDAGQWAFFVFVVVLSAALYLFMLWVVLRGGQALLDQEAVLNEKRALYGSGFDHRYDAQSAEEKDLLNPPDVRLTASFMISRPTEFMFKMKIFVGFLQVVANLGVSLEIPWPESFKRFVSFFSLANIDVFQATSLECLYETNFYSRLLIATILPISFGALVLCVYLFPKYYMINREAAQARQMPDHNQVIVEQTRLTQRKRVRRNGWKMVIFTLFLIYPLVSSTVLRIFVCKRVEDEDLLLADFKQRCHTAKWNNYAVYAAVMILVYPIGIPAFFFYMIRRYQRDGRLAEPGVVAELGFIYAAYDPAMWWFEMADMLHKLVLTSLLAFLPDSAQLPVGLWVVVLYTAAILLLKPYKHKGDDRLHLFVQTEILLMIYSGWLFFRGEDITDLIDAVLSVLLIGAVVFVFLFFLSQVLYAVYKLVKKWLADRERRRYEEWAKANPDEAARQEQLKQKRERARRRSRAAAAGGEEGETQGDMALARTKGRRSLNYGPLQRGESAAKMQRNPLAAYADLARSESASTSYVNPLFVGAPSGTLSEKRPSLLAMGGIGGPAGRGDGDEKDSDDEDAGAERGEFKEEALVSNPLFTRAASASAADDDDDFDDDGDGGRRRHESTLDEMMRQGSAANLANDPRVRQAKLREALGEELEFPAMSRGPSLRDDKEMRPSSGEGEK